MLDLLALPLFLPIVIGVVLIALIVMGAIRRYRIAEPDEAIIVTGSKGKKTIDVSG